MRMFVGRCLAVVSVLGVPSESSAQAGSVAQLLAFEVPPGQAGAFLETIAKQRAVVRRHSPASKFSVASQIVGSNTGAMVVVIEHPSAEAWGAARPKIVADPESQATGQAFRALGVRLFGSLLQANVTPEGGSSAEFGAGSVAMIFQLDVPPGKQGAALEQLAKLRTVVQGLAPQNRISVWSNVAAGTGTGRMTVRSEFPSAEAWGAASARISADAAYQQLGQGLAALGVKVFSTALMANVTPQ